MCKRILSFFIVLQISILIVGCHQEKPDSRAKTDGSPSSKQNSAQVISLTNNENHPMSSVAGRPSTALRKDLAGLYSDDNLNHAIISLFGKTNADLLQNIRVVLGNDPSGNPLTSTQKVEVLSVLVEVVSNAPADTTFSLSEIMPPTKTPNRSAVVDEAIIAKRGGVKAFGGVSAGSILGVKFVDVISPDGSGALSSSVWVGQGKWYSKAEKTPELNIQASVTIGAMLEQPPASGNWIMAGPDDPTTPHGPRKHVFLCLLPDEAILLDRGDQLQFPVGAGSRYRFINKSAECFGGFVFVCSDEMFPLSFVLLPDKGLTYLCGRGTVYKSGNIIATFPPTLSK
jgi:hypothetical protein